MFVEERGPKKGTRIRRFSAGECLELKDSCEAGGQDLQRGGGDGGVHSRDGVAGAGDGQGPLRGSGGDLSEHFYPE